MKTSLLLAGLLSAAIAGQAWVRHRRPVVEGVRWVNVTRGTVVETAVAVGQIEPRQRFQIKSKISGLVKRCLVEVGDPVRAGEALFEISPDPTPHELNDVDRRLEAAQASYARSRGDFERTEQLWRGGLVPRAQLDAVREAFDLARVALSRAQQDRDLVRNGRTSTPGAAIESIIRASAAGTLLSRSVNPGDPVVPLTSYQPGTELATIADMRDLIFRGTIDEIDVGRVHVGMGVRLKIGALPGSAVEGRVARIAPQAQQKEGATVFDVEVHLRPGDTMLRAGYSAHAEVVLHERRDVLLVPERLVSHDRDGRPFVEVAGPQGTDLVRVDVDLGASDALNVEVRSGLAEGQPVAERPPRDVS